jgi:hypothetical protein
MLEATHRAAGPSGTRTTKTGGNARIAGSNNGSSEYMCPQTMSVRSPPAPCSRTGMLSHGGRLIKFKMGTISAGAAPPIK